MKRLIRRRPSPATAIASLALFVALGGVSYGFATDSIDSREIRNETIRSRDIRNNEIRTQDLRTGAVQTRDVRNNSIRTDDIRNNEVRGRDIRNSTIRGIEIALNSIEGQDIDESTLGPVAIADTLDGIDSTGFLRADTSGPAAVPLDAGWSSALNPPGPRFDVDPAGYVHLTGEALNNAGGGNVIGTLPPEARPASVKRFAVVNDPPAGTIEIVPVIIERNGQIRPTPAAETGDRYSLDGVVFRAGG